MCFYKATHTWSQDGGGNMDWWSEWCQNAFCKGTSHFLAPTHGCHVSDGDRNCHISWYFKRSQNTRCLCENILIVVCWLSWKTKQDWVGHLGARPIHASIYIPSSTHSVQPVTDRGDSFWYLRVKVTCGFLWLYWLKGKEKKKILQSQMSNWD